MLGVDCKMLRRSVLSALEKRTFGWMWILFMSNARSFFSLASSYKQVGRAADAQASRTPGLRRMQLQIQGPGILLSVSPCPYHQSRYRWTTGEFRDQIPALSGRVDWLSFRQRKYANSSTPPYFQHETRARNQILSLLVTFRVKSCTTHRPLFALQLCIKLGRVSRRVK